MGYAWYLQELLRPLQVYDLEETGPSGAELAALGQAMDAMDSYAVTGQRESLVMTAEDAGLSKMESLFPYPATGATAQERRQAISGFLQISGDSFTAEALGRCLSACGTACRVTETDKPGVVEVSFPTVRGEPEGLETKKKIIESILPCHLDVQYKLAWCTFGDMAAAGLTWADLSAMTFQQWALLEP